MRRKIENNVKGVIADSFAYMPTTSRGGMMRSGDEPEGEDISEEDLEEGALREIIKLELDRIRQPD